MANWVDKYRKLITSSHKPHVIVADQDSLFDYAELQQAVKDDGYKLIRASTHLNVRIRFELEVRDSEQKYLIVADPSYCPPPDISTEVHFQAIGLKDLFPNLDAKAIYGLSFNALCLLSNIKPYEELGHEKTLKFLLENLYNVDFDTLTNSKPKERILNALITVFLEKNAINPPLTAFLTKLARPYFSDLITNGLNKEVLINYLHRQWTACVSGAICDVDFEDAILNKSFGYLFVFDHLNHIKVSEERFQTIPKSLRIGAYVDENEGNDTELDALLSYLEQQQSRIEDLYDQWFNIVQVLGKAKIKDMCSNNQQLRNRFNQVLTTLNQRFQRFIDNTYASLFSLSGVRRPVVVSRVLEYIKAQPDQRKALLVIDGMNYWQWLLIARELRDFGLTVHSKTTLAFIPTITAWSRQALFRGNKPNLSETNSREAILFADYWKNTGFNDYQIGFMSFSHNSPLNTDAISDNVNILGLVTDDLDYIMHGSVLGSDQLMASTQQWIQQIRIAELLSKLRSKGFKVFITTDHGNVEATGIKNLKLKEKVGSLSRGKRHIHFSNEAMLANFRELNPELVVGVKDNSVYLTQTEAFTDQYTKVVTHGGSHLWEVLIPFGEVQ